jgi:hypothetical protein
MPTQKNLSIVLRDLCFSKWCQRADLNCRPKAYESSALPLSYSGVQFEKMLRKGEFASMSSLGGALFGYFGVGWDFYLPESTGQCL